MSKFLYFVNEKIDFSQIDIPITDDFYCHHGRSYSDFVKLVEEAKQLPEIVNAIETCSATLQQTAIYQKFFTDGANRIILQHDRDGFCVVDGRHRVMAMKEAGLIIEFPVEYMATIERIENIDAIYENSRSLANNLKTNDYMAFLWLRCLSTQAASVQQQYPRALIATAKNTDECYLLFAKSDVPSREAMLQIIQQANVIQIAITKEEEIDYER